MKTKTKDIIEAFLKVMLCMLCGAFLISFLLAVNIGWFTAAMIAAVVFMQNVLVHMRLNYIEFLLKEKQVFYSTQNNEIHIPENIAEILLAQKENGE